MVFPLRLRQHLEIGNPLNNASKATIPLVVNESSNSDGDPGSPSLLLRYFLHTGALQLSSGSPSCCVQSKTPWDFSECCESPAPFSRGFTPCSRWSKSRPSHRYHMSGAYAGSYSKNLGPTPSVDGAYVGLIGSTRTLLLQAFSTAHMSTSYANKPSSNSNRTANYGAGAPKS